MNAFDDRFTKQNNNPLPSNNSSGFSLPKLDNLFSGASSYSDRDSAKSGLLGLVLNMDLEAQKKGTSNQSKPKAVTTPTTTTTAPAVQTPPPAQPTAAEIAAAEAKATRAQLMKIEAQVEKNTKTVPGSGSVTLQGWKDPIGPAHGPIAEQMALLERMGFQFTYDKANKSVNILRMTRDEASGAVQPTLSGTIQWDPERTGKPSALLIQNGVAFEFAVIAANEERARLINNEKVDPAVAGISATNKAPAAQNKANTALSRAAKGAAVGSVVPIVRTGTGALIGIFSDKDTAKQAGKFVGGLFTGSSWKAMGFGSGGDKELAQIMAQPLLDVPSATGGMLKYDRRTLGPNWGTIARTMTKDATKMGLKVQFDAERSVDGTFRGYPEDVEVKYPDKGAWVVKVGNEEKGVVPYVKPNAGFGSRAELDAAIQLATYVESALSDGKDSKKNGKPDQKDNNGRKGND